MSAYPLPLWLREQHARNIQFLNNLCEEAEMTIRNTDRTTYGMPQQMAARRGYIEHPVDPERYDTGLLGPIWGYKIVVVPLEYPRRLSWWDRIMSWPWAPWKTHVTEPNSAAPAPGNFWRYGDTLYVRPEDYEALKKAVREYPVS